MICRRDWSAETGLGRFVEFDYIGAPLGPDHIGNSGFSWRNTVSWGRSSYLPRDPWLLRVNDPSGAVAIDSRDAAISAAQRAASNSPSPVPELRPGVRPAMHYK